MRRINPWDIYDRTRNLCLRLLVAFVELVPLKTLVHMAVLGYMCATTLLLGDAILST